MQNNQITQQVVDFAYMRTEVARWRGAFILGMVTGAGIVIGSLVIGTFISVL